MKAVAELERREVMVFGDVEGTWPNQRLTRWNANCRIVD